MRYSRFNSLPQLAGVLAGFVLTITLLESGGLTVWAQRLNVGPGRALAVRATTTLHVKLAPLKVESLRRQGLVDLYRAGWSDDPAALRAAHSGRARASAKPAPLCAAPLLFASVAKRPAAVLPVLSSVPRETPLKPLPYALPSKPRVVALAGDSMMAVGLSDVMLRETAGDKDVRLIKAFRSGTGLARPDVFDWMTEYPAMIGDQQPDVVIVAIGANDGQGFVQDGKVLQFGSDAWIQVYQQRVVAFLDMLTADGARVVWVGLPPMKASGLNDRTAEINRIAYTVVSQYPQATWWNSAPYLGDDKGAYRDFATLPDGKTTRIRAADGVHMSDDGAALVADELVKWLTPPVPTQTATGAVVGIAGHSAQATGAVNR